MTSGLNFQAEKPFQPSVSAESAVRRLPIWCTVYDWCWWKVFSQLFKKLLCDASICSALYKTKLACFANLPLCYNMPCHNALLIGWQLVIKFLPRCSFCLLNSNLHILPTNLFLSSKTRLLSIFFYRSSCLVFERDIGKGQHVLGSALSLQL